MFETLLDSISNPYENINAINQSIGNKMRLDRGLMERFFPNTKARYTNRNVNDLHAEEYSGIEDKGGNPIYWLLKPKDTRHFEY
jgi:hypothetical protein